MAYVKIDNCKAGDIISVTFNIKSNVYLMTEANFQRYQHGAQYIRMSQTGISSASLHVPFDGDWYLVVEPFPSQLILQATYTHDKVVGKNWNNVNGSSVIVHNAPNTGGKDNFDKADYWEEQTGITIPQKGFICRCCHEYIDREKVDGAHVKLSHVTNSKMYIVPLCQTCNRGRKDIDVIVPANWLVELPSPSK